MQLAASIDNFFGLPIVLELSRRVDLLDSAMMMLVSAKVISRVFIALSGITLTMGMPALLAGDQQLTPIQLVRETVSNETAAGNSNGIKHMFRDRKLTAKGSQTRIYVETRDALAGMTVAYNDKPLDAKQLRDEEGRLAWLESNPDQVKRKQREQKDDADRTMRIVKALPDAFEYDYDGTVPGSASIGRDGVELIRLKFRPNPAYRPPSHIEDVLLGMAGSILIDPVEHRIAEIDGTLLQPVSFGWGILGHLDKGGHFLVKQEDVGDDSWEVSRMSLRFTGKILLFKSLAIDSDELFSHFRRVPNDTTFAQGVEMLKAEQARLQQGDHETADAGKAK
jgi:hypothetical protein